MSSLPPEWVDQFEECTGLLVEIGTISKKYNNEERQISQLNAKRLAAFLDKEQEEVDREIYEKVGEATNVHNKAIQKIKDCERILKTITQTEA